MLSTAYSLRQIKEVFKIKLQKANPLYEQIYDYIKKSIIDGELAGGERIIDGWFAEKLGVSRSPVREAFRKLEQEGLLLNQDGAMVVYKPNVEDVIELFQVRAGLEGMAVFLATKLISDQEIAELEQSLKQVRKAIKEKNISEVVRLNTFFHESMIRSSKNKRLLDMMQNINHLTLLYRNNFFVNYYGNDLFIEEHTEIFEAIKSRNAELASQKMREHILNDLDQLIEKFSRKPEDLS